MTIRTRLLLACALVISVLAMVTYSILSTFQEELQGTLGRRSQALARATINEIDRDIHHRIEILRELTSTTDAILRHLERSNRTFDALGSREAITRWVDRRDGQWRQMVPGERNPLLTEVMENPVASLLRAKQAYYREQYSYDVFAEIFITNRYGANIAQTARTSDYRQDDEDWWQRAQELGLFVGGVEYDESAGVYALEVAVRIDDRSGGLAGVLKAVLNIEEVERILAASQQESEYATARVGVVDPEGRSLIRTGPSDGATELEDGAERLVGRDGFILVSGADGSEILRAYARSRGYRSYPSQGWIAVVDFDRDEVFAPVAELRRSMTRLALAALLLVSVVAVGLAFSITRPIRRAVRAADRLAKGELGFELTASAAGEVGRLLRAMGTMLTNVRGAIGGMVASSRKVSGAAERLAGVSRELSSGAREQSVASEETSASIEEMATSIGQVAKSAGQVSGAVGETSASIEEMAVSVEAVAQNSRELATAVEQTLETMRQMATSIEQVAAYARRAGASSEGAVRQATEGESAVQNTVTAMHGISDSMDEIVAVIQKLDENSNRITQIIRMIDDISDQTHLLALNATIEAAHAGEAGKAFTVVAQEIQKLARRSASSAEEIGEIISEVRTDTRRATEVTEVGSNRVEEGVVLAKQAGDALSRISEAIRDVSATMVEVSAAAESQATASERVVATFESMRQLTHEVESATREQALGGEKITQSVDLMSSMAREVSAAATEQNRGSQQIVKAVAEIARVSVLNESTAAQIVQVSEELERQATELHRISEFFDLDSHRSESGGA